MLCRSQSCGAPILNWYSQGRASHTCIVLSTWITDMWVQMKRFDWLRHDSRDFTLMITVFLRIYWSSFCSWAHYSLQWIFISLMDSASMFLVLTSSNIVVTSLSFFRRTYIAWLSCAQDLSCKVGFFLFWLNSWSSQKGRFLLRLTFSYRGYAAIDIDAPTPVCICDFANVYHDPMTISFLQSIVSCQLCLRA